MKLQFAEKRNRKRIILLFAEYMLLAATGILAAILVERSAYKTTLVEVERYHNSRAQELDNKVQTFLLRANQLAETLRILLENYSGSERAQIEEYLQRILESAPASFIYGVGAWYEPYQFEPSNRYFGPYVHRGEKPDERILTYEWTTEEYNFHQQVWYRSGMTAREAPIFTEPYFDAGIVYMTVAIPFYQRAKGNIRGVISVDMILPQLQAIVDQINQRGGESIFIVGKSGQLLAHPQSQALVEKVKQKQTEAKKTSLLDLTLDHALQDIDRPLIYQSVIEETGWKIFVVSPEVEALKSFQNLKFYVWISTGIFLLIISVSFYAIYFLQEKAHFLRDKAFREKNSHMEDQAKLLQLGELFSDLSHELKNIFHGSLSEERVRTEDIQMSLAPLSLKEEDKQMLVKNISDNSYWMGSTERASKLSLGPQSTHLSVKRSLRGMMAQFSLTDRELEALWERILSLSEEELVYMENQIRILIQTQSLFRSMSLGRELSLAVLSFVRNQDTGAQCSFVEVCQQVERLVSTRARKHSIRWEKLIEDHTVPMSQGRLLQILLNLLLNSIEAVASLEASQQFISIQSRQTPKGLEIRIANGGPPLTLETRQKLFSRGFTTKGEKGSGIGLDVSRRLAQEAAGDLFYDVDQPNPTFVLILPSSTKQEIQRQAS